MTQDRCTVCAERIIGSEIILTHPMELLGDTCHVESRFGLFGDGVSVGGRLVQGLRQTTMAQKSFWTHSTVPLGDEAQVDARFGPFQTNCKS